MKLFKRRKKSVLLISRGKTDCEAIRSLQKHIQKMKFFGYKIDGDVRIVGDKKNDQFFAFQQLIRSKK